MTRLVFIHGMNNEKNSEERIRYDWGAALNSALDLAGLSRIEDDQIDCVFYGNLLYERTANKLGNQPLETTTSTTGNARGSGLGNVAPDVQNGLILNNEQSEILEELRQVVRASHQHPISEIIETPEQLSQNANQSGPVARGAGPHKLVLVEASRKLSGLVPGLSGPFLKLFLDQAYAYLNSVELQQEIQYLLYQQVFDKLDSDEPIIIVSHSLGTVVAYNLLGTKLRDRRVKSLYTLGCPLGSQYFVKKLGKAKQFPPNLGTWYNCWDKADYCAFNSPISSATVGFDGVANINTFDTDYNDKHSITSYLSQPALARLIAADIQVGLNV